jgi:DNA replication and repair protein RecF
MRLVRLALRDFRNFGEVSVDTDAPVVVFHGDNGQGKTNLLEAIYVLSTLKSFRSRTHAELIRFGVKQALLAGELETDGLARSFRLEITPSAKTARIDGKPPKSLPDYFGGIRSVLFAPEHLQIIRGSPLERRNFLDRAVFTAQPGFIDVARTFRRLLLQKSALLKEEHPDPAQLDVLDISLVEAGTSLTLRRREMVDRLNVPFGNYHSEIAGSSQAVLRYVSSLGKAGLAGEDPDRVADRYRTLLQEKRSLEIRRQSNLVGPQRDELAVTIDGHSARSFGSQGQVRSVVLAMKLSELQVARDRGARPLFLLDDLSSELDRSRRTRLIRLLSELDVQCFVSTTDPGLLAGALPPSSLSFRVSNGEVDGPEPRVQAAG